MYVCTYVLYVYSMTRAHVLMYIGICARCTHIELVLPRNGHILDQETVLRGSKSHDLAHAHVPDVQLG